jgi:hypothetical protein
MSLRILPLMPILVLALDAIRAAQEYQDMEQSNLDYDAPHDPQNNPEGTNHGTENGQNAVWP